MSSFGTRETKTADADDQNYTLASRPAEEPEGWACDREFFPKSEEAK